MPSFVVLNLIPYNIALKNCRAGKKQWCPFHGTRATKGAFEVDILRRDNMPEAQQKLWTKLSGAVCVCMKENPQLRKQAEGFSNTRDYCSGPPDFTPIAR